MQEKTGQGSKVKGQRGFTLIELAIALVIIGIIIGAVLKGQDLVENGRHKRLGAEIKQWEVLIWTFFDREKRFPGDGDKDGTMGESGEDPKSDFTNAAFASQPSTNTLPLGYLTFYTYFGNAGTKKNAIIVCVSEDCNTAFSSPEEIGYAKFFDGAIDDTVNGTAGKVLGFDAVTTADSATWRAEIASATAATDYTAATKAFAYFFDRKR